jgi:hypothetical protein
MRPDIIALLKKFFPLAQAQALSKFEEAEQKFLSAPIVKEIASSIESQIPITSSRPEPLDEVHFSEEVSREKPKSDNRSITNCTLSTNPPTKHRELEP